MTKLRGLIEGRIAAIKNHETVVISAERNLMLLETCLELLSALEKIDGRIVMEPHRDLELSHLTAVRGMKLEEAFDIAREAIAKAELRMIGDGK
jgi:hypothetical protein